jgi:hypothetical protein
MSRRELSTSTLLGRVAFGLTALAGAILLVRSVPDLVRYLRVRRM